MSGTGPREGELAGWQRVYDRVETQVEALAAGHARLEARNGIQHEYWDGRDNINVSRLHKAEFSRSRWEAACKELLPVDHPKLTELLESDLEDSRSTADYFDIENSELKIQVDASVELCGRTVEHEQIQRDLKELRKVLQSYEVLCADKDKKISTLLAEKEFLRNQLRALERDNAALLNTKEVEAVHATEEIHRLQKNVEELKAAALAAKNKLLVAEGKLEEMHCLAKEKDIENLKDGKLKSLKSKHAPLSNVGGHNTPTSAVALKACTSTREVRMSRKTFKEAEGSAWQRSILAARRQLRTNPASVDTSSGAPNTDLSELDTLCYPTVATNASEKGGTNRASTVSKTEIFHLYAGFTPGFSFLDIFSKQNSSPLDVHGPSSAQLPQVHRVPLRPSMTPLAQEFFYVQAQPAMLL